MDVFIWSAELGILQPCALDRDLAPRPGQRGHTGREGEPPVPCLPGMLAVGESRYVNAHRRRENYNFLKDGDDFFLLLQLN